MYEMRPYQLNSKNAIYTEWNNGNKKTLLVLPTGCGKTVVFAYVSKELVENGFRVLILAHRGELLQQAQDKLKLAAGLDSALEKGSSSSLGSPLSITVASIQTLTRESRLSQFSQDYFQAIIVDEAHHCLADSYRHILDHFPYAYVLGVTATPDRGDMRDLSTYFDSVAYQYSMAQAVKDGYLCPLRVEYVNMEIDISMVNLANGDYAAGGLGAALEDYLEDIADAMVEKCKGRKTVVFLPLIKTSRKLCALLRKRKMKAAEVNGGSSDRTKILQDFEKGKYDVLCNSMLLTEGWDCPSVDCIIVLRPTKIRSLYQQMVGRGMRLFEGKKNLLLLDFLWLSTKHNLCRPADIVGQNSEIADRITDILQKTDGGMDLTEAAEKAERDAIAEREQTLAAELKRIKTLSQYVDPAAYAMSVGLYDLLEYAPVFRWEKAPPTEKQLNLLEKRGINTSNIINAGLAAQLIDTLIERQKAGLATPKQIRCLEKYGFTHVGTWRFEDANAMITNMANNGWQVPSGITPAEYTPQQ